MTTAMDTPGDLLAPGAYRLDPERSSIAFRTRHLFGLGAVHGRFGVTAGRVEITGSGAPRVTATAAAASFDTGLPKRDALIRDRRFLDAAAHPAIGFTATGLSRRADAWTLDGELTVRDVTRPVTVTLTSAEATPNGARVQATARVDRYAFGITAARGLAARHLNLEFDAVIERD
ncbi:YceI family protein [Actinomadura roseirufa]|uniref:YceI family protein n=1 Tax=Actinomadura roseirufa TaxID=2094049 RepID=UPI001040EC5D|nr:YceI family protein [Actinomadura roseirufa]